MSDGYNLETDYSWVIDAALNYGNSVGPDELQHFGTLGMKWGHHKAKVKAELKGLGPDSVTKTTKYGEKVTISKNPPGGIHNVLGLMSAKYRTHYNEMAYLTIKDANGKSVGNASVWKKGKDELYLNWLGINTSARGKGYASAVMQAATEYGKAEGLTKLTLEVPGKSPDARHIYEKLGFTATKEPSAREAKADTVWGGLTSMEYDFSKIKHGESETMDEVDDFLEHFGVPGMKWGRHKPKFTESRRQYKGRVKSERQAFDQQKLGGVLKTSIKGGENVLVSTRIPGHTVKTIMTGKEFVRYAGQGGLLDAKTTDVFASLDKKQKKFVMNPEMGKQYVPTGRV